jgi:hypothetical protein
MNVVDLRTGKPRCACCGGAGRVLSAEGERRPCTRCQPFEICEAWFASRRPPPTPPQEQSA